MKIAIFFSFHSKGFLNHTLRLSGFCAENPEVDCVWFNLAESPPCSDYSLGKFDKFVLLADPEGLSENEKKYFSSHRLIVETLSLDYAQKVKPHFFTNRDERFVFCASSESEKKWNKKFWEYANQVYPTLFLCQEQGVLEQGAVPGPMTLFSPVDPQLHEDAISNAVCVISTAWEPCLSARAAGRRAIKLSEQASPNNPWEVPEVVVQGRTAKAVFEDCRKVFQAHPEKKLSNETNPEINTERELVHLTSISDFSYLPFYLGMIENVLKLSRNKVKLHLLALDNLVAPFLEDRYPGLVNVVELKDVWTPNELRVIEQRSVAFRAFSSKPKILEKVLREHQGPTFHCDSDVYFFTGPEKLLETFANGHTVVFPHWNDVYPKGRNDGLYNAGMIGVRPGAEKFLKWWGEQCLANCTFDPENGVVGDQAYLDFAPILFEGVSVYRKKDHNVARWNLGTLGIHFSTKRDQLKSREGRSVQTFHAAFIDSFGFFEFKFCWDQLVTFFSGFSYQNASPAFLKNTLTQQQRYWLSLSRGLKSRETVYRLFPLLGEEPEWKAPLFWMQGLGGFCLKRALAFRDTLSSFLPFITKESAF